MSNFARIINNVAVDVSTDPENHFHPDIAAMFVAVPDDVKPGWVLVDDSWQAPSIVAAPEASAPRHITPAAYFRRFTISEEAAIRTAAQNNMVLTVLLARVEAAKFVDLDDPGVSDGLAALVHAELLTAERAEAIRTAPVQESEIPT